MLHNRLKYLEEMAGCFDCEAMCDAYRYSLSVMENVPGTDEEHLEEQILAV